MKTLTLEKALELHHELWMWLHGNPAAEKEDWPRWGEIQAEYGRIKNRCFMCRIATDMRERQEKSLRKLCNYCPLDWTDRGRYESCECEPGLYENWLLAQCHEEYEKAADLAYTIAELPLKEEYMDEVEG